MTSGTSQTFTFDLRGQKLNVTVGEKMTGDFTASYLSLMGLGEILGDDVVQITGTPPNYVVAAAAEASTLMTQYLNPPQRYPVDMNTRLMPGVMPHLLETGAGRHDGRRVLPLGAQYRHGRRILLPGEPG